MENFCFTFIPNPLFHGINVAVFLFCRKNNWERGRLAPDGTLATNIN